MVWIVGITVYGYNSIDDKYFYQINIIIVFIIDILMVSEACYFID